MIAFWIAAALLSAAAAGLMLARAARVAGVQAEDPALAVHRRQLGEIDELAERGLLADGERRAARAEAGRRLLAAADRGGEVAEPGAGRRAALAAAALTPLLAMAIYLFVGQPGAPDRPYERRVGEWLKTDPRALDAPQMAAVLRVIASRRPDDPEPLRNLALAELASERPIEAIEALRRAVALAPKRADLWEALGEAFVVQGGGEIGADARAAFDRALELDPKSESARYHLARAAIAGGDLAGGVAGWRALLADLPAGDPRRQALGAEIASVQSAGGLVPAEPDATADRIRGMVEGLAARLEDNPDDPEGWVRLVRAYAVLGEGARRDAALARARGLFKQRPEVLRALDAAAEAPR